MKTKICLLALGIQLVCISVAPTQAATLKTGDFRGNITTTDTAKIYSGTIINPAFYGNYTREENTGSLQEKWSGDFDISLGRLKGEKTVTSNYDGSRRTYLTGNLTSLTFNGNYAYDEYTDPQGNTGWQETQEGTWYETNGQMQGKITTTKKPGVDGLIVERQIGPGLEPSEPAIGIDSPGNPAATYDFDNDGDVDPDDYAEFDRRRREFTYDYNLDYNNDSVIDGKDEEIFKNQLNGIADSSLDTGTSTGTETSTGAGAEADAGIDAEASPTPSPSPSPTSTPINHPPVLDPIGKKTVLEGETLSIVLHAYDADGDALTYSASPLPAGAVFSPIFHFYWPTYFAKGSYTVTFQVKDSKGAVDSEDVIIEITPNLFPVLEPVGDQTVKEKYTLTFYVKGSDPEGTSVTYGVGRLPPGASFDSKTGMFTWTPEYGQAGVYEEVVFSVSDGVHTTFGKFITITVVKTNRSPKLGPVGDKSVYENDILTFQVKATDEDGDELTYTAHNLPTPYGASFDSKTGTVTWVTRWGQVGVYSNISFSVTDGKDTTQSNTMTITILKAQPSPSPSPTNQPPVLDPIGDKTVKVGDYVTINLHASDPDDHFSTLTYSASNIPPGAIGSKGFFSFCPIHTQAGQTYIVHFEVRDPKGAVDSEDVSIEVIDANQTPIPSPIPSYTPEPKPSPTPTPEPSPSPEPEPSPSPSPTPTPSPSPSPSS